MKDARNSTLDTRNSDWESVRQRIAAANAALAGIDEPAPEVVQQIWARRAAQLAEVPVEEEEGEQITLVAIQLGCEVYGLDVQYVVDIKLAAQITRVPRVPDWMAGVTNLRGRILSVVDLRRFFGLACTGRNEEDRPAQRPDNSIRSPQRLVEGMPYLVFVETPEMEVALLVDDVLAVEVLPASRVQDAVDTVRGLRPEYVQGVAARGGRGEGSMVVLDLSTMLADKQLIVHEEIL